MLTYSKLWILLKKRGMKKTDLKKPNARLSSATLAKLGKNEYVSSEILGRNLDFLNCQPGDIMENVTPEDIEKAGQAMNDLVNQTMTILESTTDMSREEILKQFQQELPTFMEKLSNNVPDILGINEMMASIKEKESSK